MTVYRLPVQYGPRKPSHIKRRVKYRQPLASVRTLRTDAERAYALYQHGVTVDDADPRAGLRIYSQALELDPTLAIAWTNLGNCRYKLHDTDGARAAYQQALRLDHEQPEALYNLGCLHAERGLHADAVPLLSAAVGFDRSFADAWFNLGISLWSLKQGSLQAVAAFREYLRLTEATTDASESRWRAIAWGHVDGVAC
jgi:tetratricopeptide (TPR) repeat protein